ncbi:MAG: Fe-S protein assembly co-chaperone HscB [Gammaproteobacteria bacterium]|nr:Fe-S protein assembly co-chaperone HscB [Gammaproteobacteria bacterium]MBT4492150.1 Fe-S protein assembly co-chaperone HscB [Gammaproteobacteria bacterium]MBT7369194.1 Fe-S protein assembly co-chaperone HscB [Gammaproteobacteria bacterium]
MDFNQNYFEIFGLPVTFKLDLDGLSRRYRELQKELHPDNYASSTEHEKRLSMQWSSLVNAANETLKSPQARAIYMLELKGVDIDHNPVLPPAFLMEQIELREELESLEDDPAGLDKLDTFKVRVKDVMSGLERQFEAVVNEDDEKALTAVYEMQFMTKLMASAHHLEEKLLDY